MRILGISPFHDSSVVIINDGRIEYYTKEERLSRIKRDHDPQKALDFIMKNIEGNIDVAVLSGEMERDNYNLWLQSRIKKSFDCELI